MGHLLQPLAPHNNRTRILFAHVFARSVLNLLAKGDQRHGALGEKRAFSMFWSSSRLLRRVIHFLANSQL